MPAYTKYSEIYADLLAKGESCIPLNSTTLVHRGKQKQKRFMEEERIVRAVQKWAKTKGLRVSTRFDKHKKEIAVRLLK